MLILVFMVPFYIGYFVVSNIRLCEYLVCGSGAANLRLCIQMRNDFSKRDVLITIPVVPIFLWLCSDTSLELNA